MTGASTQPSHSPEKILIAEDSPTQAQRLRHILEQQGYEVGVAANGRLALEMAPQFRPALIISDVVMPEMDGYELSRGIKADSALRDIPVILVTTMSDPQDVIRGLECGADNFVLKPYDERYLLDRVRYVVLNRQMRRPEDAGMAVEIYFNGQRHFITADRLQILNLLLSTYDAAIQRNKELTRTQEELQSLNTRLDAANTELHAANRFLDSVIENIPDMIFVKDAADLRFVRFNRAGEELLGYFKDDLFGKNDYDFFLKEEADFFTSRDREVLARGVMEDIPEEPVRTRSKGNRILHTKKIPILDEHDRPRYLLGISQDVTEQKEKEREILRLNAALEQRAAEVEAANRAKSTFLATMSHEIRTPLNGVLGMVELLGLTRLDAEQRTTLEIVRESGKSLLRIIDDILDFSKIEAGRLEVRPEAASIKEVIEGVHKIYSGNASSKGLLLKHSADPRISPTVWVDPWRLRQILSNFVSNAIKFTSKGTIEI
ncbi:MAG: response regulator, partial [Pseudomonadota bacterium]